MHIDQAPHFILFAGLAGSGKSTLALELSKSIDRAALIRKDLIVQQLILAGDDPDAASWRGFEVAFSLAEDLLTQAITPILDIASIQPFVYERTSSISKRLGVPLHVIHCTIEPEQRFTRILQRSPLLIQQRSGNYNNPSMLYANLPADRLVIDTASPIDTCLGEIAAYIERKTITLPIHTSSL